MKLRTVFLSVTLALLITLTSGLSVTFADVIGDCSLTGYTYMGGGSSRLSVSDGPDSQKDYFLAQPLFYVEGVSSNMWGFGWIKFDNLSETTVEHAYMVLDLLGVGAMETADASADYPATLDLYSPGSVDAEDLAGSESWDLRTSLKDSLFPSGTPLMDTITMSANGTYYIDITQIYNGWVTGTIENNGLILVSYSENEMAGSSTGCVGAQFASFNSQEGHVPYISTTNTSSVPVPGTILLLGTGLAGLTGMVRRKR